MSTVTFYNVQHFDCPGCGEAHAVSELPDRPACFVGHVAATWSCDECNWTGVLTSSWNGGASLEQPEPL